MTLALTTNRETSADLLRKAHRLAASENIELDIWSASRIAAYLDTDPRGQIIREQHLGKAVELMSIELLQKLGLSSIKDHLYLPENSDYVAREHINLDGGHVMVVGDSGMGKTTVCANHLERHLNKGAPGLVLKHEYIQESTTIEEAVELELRRQRPALQTLSGRKGLEFGSVSSPFMLVVEDVNNSENPRALLEKLINWILLEERKPEGRSYWRIVCPLWPRHFELLARRQGIFALITTVRMGCFTAEEGVQAVMNRSATLLEPVERGKAVSIVLVLTPN